MSPFKNPAKSSHNVPEVCHNPGHFSTKSRNISLFILDVHYLVEPATRTKAKQAQKIEMLRPAGIKTRRRRNQRQQSMIRIINFSFVLAKCCHGKKTIINERYKNIGVNLKILDQSTRHETTSIPAAKHRYISERFLLVGKLTFRRHRHYHRNPHRSKSFLQQLNCR